MRHAIHNRRCAEVSGHHPDSVAAGDAGRLAGSQGVPASHGDAETAATVVCGEPVWKCRKPGAAGPPGGLSGERPQACDVCAGVRLVGELGQAAATVEAQRGDAERRFDPSTLIPAERS